jgi:hypothetical protein
MKMSQITGLLKREIPMLLVSVLIILVMANAFFDIPQLEPVSLEGMVWSNIVGGFALYLGATSLVLHHLRRIWRRQHDWIFSIPLLATLLLMCVIGFTFTPEGPDYKILYDQLLNAFGRGISSFLGFLIIIAAFRSFRVHNVEASLLLFSCAFTIMMNAPIGEVIWAGFPIIGTWFTNYPNAVVKRALRLIIGLGVLGWALQLIVGRETRWVGEVMGGEG